MELTDLLDIWPLTISLLHSCLPVNRAHNVVLACYSANKLQEYTAHGCLTREICLQAWSAHVMLSSWPLATMWSVRWSHRMRSV